LLKICADYAGLFAGMPAPTVLRNTCGSGRAREEAGTGKV